MMHRKVRFRRSARAAPEPGGGLSWLGIGLGVVLGVGVGIALQSVVMGTSLVIAFAISFGLVFGPGAGAYGEDDG